MDPPLNPPQTQQMENNTVNESVNSTIDQVGQTSSTVKMICKDEMFLAKTSRKHGLVITETIHYNRRTTLFSFLDLVVKE